MAEDSGQCRDVRDVPRCHSGLVSAAVDHPKRHQAIRLFQGQRVQQHPLDDAVDGDDDAESQGQSPYRGQRESRSSEQSPSHQLRVFRHLPHRRPSHSQVAPHPVSEIRQRVPRDHGAAERRPPKPSPVPRQLLHIGEDLVHLRVAECDPQPRPVRAAASTPVHPSHHSPRGSSASIPLQSRVRSSRTARSVSMPLDSIRNTRLGRPPSPSAGGAMWEVRRFRRSRRRRVTYTAAGRRRPAHHALQLPDDGDAVGLSAQPEHGQQDLMFEAAQRLGHVRLPSIHTLLMYTPYL